MTVALLFPGQGTQQPAMLPWLEADPAARPLLARMAGVLGGDWRAHASDPVWAHANAVAQPLVTGVSLAALAALAPGLPRVVAVAGYSVGELAACVAAGMLEADDAMTLAVERSAAMDACAVDGTTGLLGVSDVEPDDLDAACARWGLDVAIRTGERRCVVGGSTVALAQVAAFLAERGARATPLGVRVASHTRVMRAAVPLLAQAFAQVRWRAPRIAWVAGVTGAVVRDVAGAQRLLAEQVASTVRWDACMDTVAERRPDAVLELGPGTALARLWRERHPGIPVRSCDEFAAAAEILAWAAGPA